MRQPTSALNRPAEGLILPGRPVESDATNRPATQILLLGHQSEQKLYKHKLIRQSQNPRYSGPVMIRQWVPAEDC
jgi:hypothetical protein